MCEINCLHKLFLNPLTVVSTIELIMKLKFNGLLLGWVLSKAVFRILYL